MSGVCSGISQVWAPRGTPLCEPPLQDPQEPQPLVDHGQVACVNAGLEQAEDRFARSGRWPRRRSGSGRSR